MILGKKNHVHEKIFLSIENKENCIDRSRL